MATIPPATLAAFRIAVAAVVLVAIVRATGRAWPRDARVWLHFLALGCLGNALPFFLIGWGQERVASSTAGLLMGVMPVVTLVLAHFLVPGERMNGARALGFLMGFAGLALLFGPAAAQQPAGGTSELIRRASVLGGALCYATNNVVAKRLPAVDPLVTAAGVTLVTAVWMGPLVAALDAPWTLSPTSGGVAAALWLGVAATALATVVYFRLIQSAGPTFVSLVNYAIPVVALAAGVALLGESVGASSLAALAFILVGIAFARR